MKSNKLKEKIENLKKRDLFLRIIRKFFFERDFLEVDAPILVPTAGMEPHLDPFIAEGSVSKRRYFLPTSPEFYLKKILAAQVNRVFSLSPSFRDEMESFSHSHQFLMLEWYRSESSLVQIVKDCEELLREIENSFEFEPILINEKKKIALGNGIYVFELSDFLKEVTGYSLFELDTDEKWQRLAKSLGAEVNSNWTGNDCFSFISVSIIEKKLKGFDKPVILKGYPQFQCALAEVRKDGLSDRFELFVAGIEIANAYNELTTREANFKRYLHFQEERKKMGKPPHPEDLLFFEAVEEMPQSSGIALGVDRFLSILLQCPIQECQNR